MGRVWKISAQERNDCLIGYLETKKYFIACGGQRFPSKQLRDLAALSRPQFDFTKRQYFDERSNFARLFIKTLLNETEKIHWT